MTDEAVERMSDRERTLRTVEDSVIVLYTILIGGLT